MRGASALVAVSSASPGRLSSDRGVALGSQPPPLLSALLHLVYYQIEAWACDLDCDAISLTAAATFTLHRTAFIAFNSNNSLKCGDLRVYFLCLVLHTSRFEKI